MPLLRAKDEFYESVEGIHFLMRDPDRRKYVACLITRVALIGRGTAHEPPLGSMQVFDNYRGEIEQAVGDRWDGGQAYDRHIIRISTTQFPQQPLREAEPST